MNGRATEQEAFSATSFSIQTELSSPLPDPEVDRPICLFGVGRSGTSILLRMLSDHESLGWPSSFNQKFPRWPSVALYSRILDLPWLGSRMSYKWPITPKAREAVRVLHYLTDGVFHEPRRLTSTDATPAAIHHYRNYVKALLRYQGKDRFLQKHTGFPRTDYLSAIFPDAKFIHIARDGRAVANSLLNVNFWDGTMKSWWWEKMLPEYEREYLASNKEPIVLAAIVWKTVMHYIRDAINRLEPHRILEIRYDRLIAHPQEMLREVCEFCDLPFSKKFKNRISKIRLRDEDTKWTKELTPRQISLLESSLRDELNRYGFDS